jgi:hypothetical protein
VPRPLRSIDTRALESLHKLEFFQALGGCGKHRKSVCRCARRDETGRECSSWEDGSTADACWAARKVRAVRRAFERPREKTRSAVVDWWRQSTAGGDEHRKTHKGHEIVRRHDLMIDC